MASLSTASLLWTILVTVPLARSQNLVMVLGKVMVRTWWSHPSWL